MLTKNPIMPSVSARLRPAIGFRMLFGAERTEIRRTDLADSPDLAARLSVRQRMGHLLRRGAMSAEAIAQEIEADVETVRRTARRYRQQFVSVGDGQLALAERRAI